MGIYNRRGRWIGAVALLSGLSLTNAAHAAVEISTKPTSNMSCSGGVCTPTAKKAVLNVSDLDGMLASGDATVKSTAQNPDIEIDAKLSWSNTSHFTLDAYHSIAFNKAVTALAAATLTITTNDGGTGGDYRFFGSGHVEFKDAQHGQLYINGQSYRLFATMKHIDRADYMALASNIDAKGQTYDGNPIPAFGNEGYGAIEGLGNTISNLTINGDGFVGELEGTIRDLGLLSVNVSSVAASDYVGALVGKNNGVIEYSYATGQVSASGFQTYVGGLIGFNSDDELLGVVKVSHADVSVIGTGEVSAVGGLIGLAEGQCDPCVGLIDRSYSTGSVTGADTMMVGSLIGENLGIGITNSYAVGAVTAGNNAFAGGLIGGNINPGVTSQPMSSLYSTGSVSGGEGTDIGGLIGEDTAPPNISNAYWDLDTSGVTNPSQGAGNIPNDPGITGLSDAQLKSSLPEGFDPTIWKQSAKINNGYPYLIDNAPPKK